MFLSQSCKNANHYEFTIGHIHYCNIVICFESRFKVTVKQIKFEGSLFYFTFVNLKKLPAELTSHVSSNLMSCPKEQYFHPVTDKAFANPSFTAVCKCPPNTLMFLPLQQIWPISSRSFPQTLQELAPQYNIYTPPSVSQTATTSYSPTLSLSLSLSFVSSIP